MGLNISVNTDDPKMFNNRLAEEYFVLIDEFGFNLNEIKKMMNATILSSWCQEGMKIELLNKVNEYYARLTT